MAQINVLHVEDDPDDAFFLARAFAKAQPVCAVQRVAKGEEALDYLGGAGAYGDRAAHPFPDLVVLDLKLPGLSGFEVLAWVRAQEKLKELPIVVLSGSWLDEDRRRAEALGATGYLVKSCLYNDVAEAVLRLVPAASPQQLNTDLAA